MRSWPFLVAAGMLAVFFFAGLGASQYKSETFDEPQHLLGGVVIWRLNDYRINPTNGNLPKRLVGLGLMLGGYDQLPERENNDAWHSSSVRGYGQPFMYESNDNLPGMLWWGRAAIVCSTTLIGLVVFVIARKLFGDHGALVSLAVFVLSPTVLAHGTLATSGMVVAGCFLATVASFWWCAHRLTAWSLVLAISTVGLLSISKMSAVLVGPMLILLGILRVAVGQQWEVAYGGKQWFVAGRLRVSLMVLFLLFIQLAAVVVFIWAAFGFRYSPYHPDEGPAQVMYQESLLVSDSKITSVLNFVNTHQLLPEGYTYGLGRVIRNAQARASFLAGEWSIDGWWWFFPFSILTKTPISILALWLLGIAAGVWMCVKSTEADGDAGWKRIARRLGMGLYRTSPLWTLMFVYGWIALRSNLNIGHRHILPSIMAALALSGAAAYWFRTRYLVLKALVVIALMGLVFESALVYPHHLSFFNAAIGGPSQGYRYMIDSSLDWGQELPGLKRYVEEQPDLTSAGTPLYLSYFGTAIPERWGIENRPLPSFFTRREDPLRMPQPYEPGVYAISATMLQSVYTPIRGEWCPFYESHYQDKGNRLRELLKLQLNDGEAFDALLQDQPKEIEILFAQFEDLRFARLCAYLRQYEPMEQIGYAINLYNLDQEQLSAALYGPPPPMAVDPQINGLTVHH